VARAYLKMSSVPNKAAGFSNSTFEVSCTFFLRTGLSIPEALGKLSIGGPLPIYVEDQKKRSSPPQIVEFECISDQNSIILTTEERIAVSVNYSCSFTKKLY